MEIKSEEVIAFFSGLVPGLIAVFTFGRRIGSISSKVKDHDDELLDLRRQFLTADGEPRLMSYAAHDKIQASCQKLMRQRLDDHAQLLSKHDEKLDRILEAVLAADNRKEGGN